MQRLTSARNRIVSDSVVRRVLIDTLALKMLIQNGKKIRPLKARSTLVEEWIRHMVDIGSHVYDANLIEEVISKKLRTNQNGRCFTGSKVICKRIVGKAFLETMVFLEIIQKEGHRLL